MRAITAARYGVFALLLLLLAGIIVLVLLRPVAMDASALGFLQGIAGALTMVLVIMAKDLFDTNDDIGGNGKSHPPSPPAT